MQNYPAHALLFLQQANYLRKSLQKSLGDKYSGIEDITTHLLNFQLLLYHSQYQIDCSKHLAKNTQNLVKIIGCLGDSQLKSSGQKRKKFDIKWKSKKKQSPKKQLSEFVPLQETIDLFKPHDKNNNKPMKQEMQEDKKKKPVQFISANSLPKGTSVRKKFVPPFKKNERDDEPKMVKLPTDSKQDDDMDPRFKNLEAKLVQIIQSEIVERDRKVQWGQIAGLGFAKKIIHQMIVWPMLRPDIFTGLRAPPRGILLFGPPGTGKTMIGRAIASEASATFFSISASSLTSKWVGESEKLVRTLFAVARVKQPSVIFIDEIDSLLCARKEGQQQSSRRVKTQFLVELDGAKTNNQERILIIGATNLPQELDDAVRRRFVKRLYIPLPNFEGRKQLISTLTKNSSFDLREEELDDVALATKGYSGADLYSLCSEAAMMPLRMLTSIESIRTSEVPVARLDHFMAALDLVRPSVNSNLLQSFEEWNKNFGSYQLSPDELEICNRGPLAYGKN